MLSQSSARSSSSIRNLVELLESRAQAQPAARPYLWLTDGEHEGPALSYADLDQKARRIAAMLQSISNKGETALLLYSPGLQFIEALFGCFYAGIIAVPAYAPGSTRELARVEGMLRDAGCGIALTSEGTLDSVRKTIAAISPKILCLATDSIEDEAATFKSHHPQADHAAYLQYTSGSTSSPKGVMVTHTNVLENLKYIQTSGGFTETSLSVNWLPHFHDMGLIYGILQPIFTGFPAVSFSPSAFIHKPQRWLNAITRYAGTHCGGPNFAYDLCVERISPEECDALHLNLSSWQVAFNGAEPVRYKTLQQFAKRFARSGFRSSAFYPVYGLAEATLKVSSGSPGEGSRVCTVDDKEIKKHKVHLAGAEATSCSTFVSCGRWQSPHEVLIVHPESGRCCKDDEVGEIWVSGPSVAAGYWRDHAATKATFRATTATGDGPYLRTGDLGFVYGGELYITGRLKDCIIIRGKNHYPQDIEESVEDAHAAIRRNGTAAFAIEQEGSERLVVVSEVKRRYKGDWIEVIESIRRVVGEAHEVQAFAVILIKAGALPKTSSGKVQRKACKVLFLENKLPVVQQSILETAVEDASNVHLKRKTILAAEAGSRRTAVESYLRQITARTLGYPVEQIGVKHSLTSLGLDSLMVLDLKRRIEQELEVVVSIETLLGADIGSIGENVLRQIELGAPVAVDKYPLQKEIGRASCRERV